MTAGNQGRPDRWLGVQTLPRQEFVAQGDLQDKGYRVFVPWQMHETRSARKVRSEKRAFFEEYIFVFVRADQAVYPVRKSKGVHCILGAKAAPTTIPDRIMRQVFAICPHGPGDGYVPQSTVEALPPSLKAGDRCQITGGPFASFLGEIERVDRDGTIKLWVDIFGRPTPVELPSSQVSEPASP